MCRAVSYRAKGRLLRVVWDLRSCLSLGDRRRALGHVSPGANLATHLFWH